MTDQKQPRRHHYIPQMILRNFRNPEGGLYFWRREFPVGDVRSANTQNLFLEDDLYTLVGDEGERDTSLEIAFAKLESTGAPLLKNLLELVRSGQRPRLNEQAWEFFHLFHYYAGKRSSAWHRRFVTRDEVIALTKELAKDPRFSDAERASLDETEDLDRVMNNARIAAQGTPPPPELLEEMRKRGLAIYVAPHGGSFIIGDHPSAATRVGEAARATASGKSSFMPIAWDVAIGYFPKQRFVHVEHLSRAQLRMMNEATARQSEMIAGRSPELLSSLSSVGYQTPAYFTTAHYLES